MSFSFDTGGDGEGNSSAADLLGTLALGAAVGATAGAVASPSPSAAPAPPPAPPALPAPAAPPAPPSPTPTAVQPYDAAAVPAATAQAAADERENVTKKGQAATIFTSSAGLLGSPTTSRSAQTLLG